MSTTDARYTIISADTHAGGSHAQYREFLEAEVPRRLRRLAGRVQEPVQRPRRPRGACATGTTRCATRSRTPTASSARSSSPTRCRRSSRASCCSPGRPSPTSTSTAWPASAPTTAGSTTSASRYPERRAGIGQIFLNDIDDAIEDVHWIKEHGLRGGILLPTIPPDVDWIKPLNHPDYDRLWAVCEDLEVPVNCHGGTGLAGLRAGAVVGADDDRRGAVLLPAPAAVPAAVRRVRALPRTSSS